MDAQTRQCPQCKGTVSQNAQECPLCGIIFKKYEENRDRLKKTAVSAYENSDLPHSRKLFETLIERFPDLTDLAQSYLKSIEYQESNQLYQKALSEEEEIEEDNFEDKHAGFWIRMLSRKNIIIIDIYKYGYATICNHFKDLFYIAIISYFPSGLLVAYYQINIEKSAEISSRTLFTAIIFSLIFNLIGNMAIYILIENKIKGLLINFRQTVGKALLRLYPVLTTMVLMLIIFVPLSLLLVIPGIIAMVYLSFVPEIVTLREESGIDALKYSYRIVRGLWWKVFGFYFVLIIAIIIASTIVEFFLSIVFSGEPLIFIANIIDQIFSIFYGVLSVIFFLNLDYSFHHEYKKEAQQINSQDR